MVNAQQGSVSIEYAISVAACVVIIILGAGQDSGVLDVFLGALRRSYASYSSLLGSMDTTP